MTKSALLDYQSRNEAKKAVGVFVNNTSTAKDFINCVGTYFILGTPKKGAHSSDIRHLQSSPKLLGRSLQFALPSRSSPPLYQC